MKRRSFLKSMTAGAAALILPSTVQGRAKVSLPRVYGLKGYPPLGEVHQLYLVNSVSRLHRYYGAPAGNWVALNKKNPMRWRDLGKNIKIRPLHANPIAAEYGSNGSLFCFDVEHPKFNEVVQQSDSPDGRLKYGYGGVMYCEFEGNVVALPCLNKSKRRVMTEIHRDRGISPDAEQVVLGSKHMTIERKPEIQWYAPILQDGESFEVNELPLPQYNDMFEGVLKREPNRLALTASRTASRNEVSK